MIVVNGRQTDVPGAVTVQALLERLDVPDRGVAVAVDAEVVPRGAWSTHVVEEGARVEVVGAIQGG